MRLHHYYLSSSREHLLSVLLRGQACADDLNILPSDARKLNALIFQHVRSFSYAPILVSDVLKLLMKKYEDLV